MTEGAQTRNALISLLIAGFGLLLCAAPFVLGIAVDKGGGAAVIFGGILVLTGLIAAKLYFGRASLLGKMYAGKNLLAEWPDPENPGEKFIISTEGFLFQGELYPFEGMACRLENAEIDATTGAHLILTVSHQRKYHRSSDRCVLPFPPDQKDRAKAIADALRNKFNRTETPV